MLHEPAPQTQEPDNAMGSKAKLGVKLFWLYCLIYASFVVINTVAPSVMETKVVLGQNLAVVYGFGLILFAIALGLVYNHMCTRMEETMNAKQGEEE